MGELLKEARASSFEKGLKRYDAFEKFPKVVGYKGEYKGMEGVVGGVHGGRRR